MTILKVNLNTISIRAREMIADPRFFSDDLSDRFSVTINENKRILSVLHGKGALDIDFLFSEVLARFALNKTNLEILNIPFREIESFLRDENHLPAFTDSLDFVERAWGTSKGSLVAAVALASFGPEVKLLKEQISRWDEMNLAGKNALLAKILSTLGWELILYFEETLTVKPRPKEIENFVIEAILQEIFRAGGKVLPMKVVAV